MQRVTLAGDALRTARELCHDWLWQPLEDGDAAPPGGDVVALMGAIGWRETPLEPIEVKDPHAPGVRCALGA
jgi:hypothetical protein